MALVDGGIAAKTVVITAAVDIPYMDAGPPCEDYGDGMIVMSAIFLFELQVAEGQIAGGGGDVRDMHIKQR
jgi:hypothetical protein